MSAEPNCEDTRASMVRGNLGICKLHTSLQVLERGGGVESIPIDLISVWFF